MPPIVVKYKIETVRNSIGRICERTIPCQVSIARSPNSHYFSR